MNLDRGTIVLVGLDPTLGREQQGTRPCVVVSDPDVTASARFPMIAVVPVSGTAGEGALYPRLETRTGGLRRPSWALVDQLRSIDKRRVMRAFVGIDASELTRIDEGLRSFLGLSTTPPGR
ncbi:MAG: type II toxin-antitoxin system PemK/MazF family toxin [Actinomycetota bacterium]